MMHSKFMENGGSLYSGDPGTYAEFASINQVLSALTAKNLGTLQYSTGVDKLRTSKEGYKASRHLRNCDCSHLRIHFNYLPIKV